MTKPTEKDREKAQGIVNEYFRIVEQDRPMPFVMRIEGLLTAISTALADEREAQREADAQAVFEMPNPQDATVGIDVTDPWQGGYERARVDAIAAIRPSRPSHDKT